jgi:hypothetical protein
VTCELRIAVVVVVASVSSFSVVREPPVTCLELELRAVVCVNELGIVAAGY